MNKNLPTYPFSLSIYFGIRKSVSRGTRIDWDMKARREREEKAKASSEQDYFNLRRRPFHYDALYGTNHMGLNGRIPSIAEIKIIDQKRSA